MFKHLGSNRTYDHNLQLASLLSFVAGIVNVTGFFAVQRLTTNVTGHFAFFADDLIRKDFGDAWVYLLYILSFFFGAFFSNFLIEIVSRRSSRFVNLIPVVMEILILTNIAILSRAAVLQNANLIACCLLFAMGLQNSLVTSISNSTVRTTHLTGLFTDLGIELSQLMFFIQPDQRQKLLSSVKLRLAIISFFFMGCIIGGVIYFFFGILSLMLAVGCLGIGLVYDTVKVKVAAYARKHLS
jgi:uncharacterized membrane protein YoaK (UPF0700 family)